MTLPPTSRVDGPKTGLYGGFSAHQQRAVEELERLRLRAPCRVANASRNAEAGFGRRRRWGPARDALWDFVGPLIEDGARVAIVGAGNGDDLPLRRIARRAGTVTLIDLDPLAAQARAAAARTGGAGEGRRDRPRRHRRRRRRDRPRRRGPTGTPRATAADLPRSVAGRPRSRPIRRSLARFPARPMTSSSATSSTASSSTRRWSTSGSIPIDAPKPSCDTRRR